MAAAQARLARAKQLQKANEDRQTRDKAGDFHAVAVLRRTAAAIRDELLGRRGGGAHEIAVMDVVGTANRVIEHMADLEEQGASLERRVEDSLVLREVLKFSERLAVAAVGSVTDVRVAWAAARVDFEPAAFNQHQLGRYVKASTFARDPDTRYKLEEAAERLDEAREIEKAALKTANDQLATEFNAAIKGLMASWEAGELTRAQYNERAWELKTEYERQAGEMQTGYRKKLDAAMAGYAAVGWAMREGILEQSRITQEEADAWAQAQQITKSAATRLKKLGYAVSDVRRDMAEFQRLTGGRLRAVVIATDGSKRANAEGIHGHGSAVINLGSHFDKRTLWHELGHHLEADPSILAAARGFLAERADGTGLHSLAQLTGNSAYRPNERAYRDSFFSHYVGKHYPDATEVMSMGIESFSSPALLGERMHQDPGMFALIEGILKTAENPLVKLIHDVRAENAEAGKERDASEGQVREEATRLIASRVRLMPAADLSEVPAQQEALSRFLSRYTAYFGLEEMKGYVAEGTEVYVVWRSKRTKALTQSGGRMRWSRPQKGYVVCRFSASDRSDYVGRTSYAHHAVLGDDIDAAKVAIHLWITDGVVPRAEPSPMELKKYAQAA